MTFATLLRDILRLSVRWLLTRLDADLPTPSQPAFAFDDDDFFSTDRFFDADDDAPEETFEAFNNLPPPPTTYTPQANLEHIIITIPRELTHERLDSLHAAAITKPLLAEKLRWRLLKTLGIEPTPTADTPIQAWLDYTSQISNTPVTLEILSKRRDLSEKATSWIRFLIGVDTDPQRLDDIPEDERC